MTSQTTFGASIVPKQSDGRLDLTTTLDSPALTPAVSTEDLNNTKPIPPHSPFYQHPPQSFEKVHSRQSSRTNIAAPTEKDVELGASAPLTASDSHPFASKVSVDCTKECRMWPSKQALAQEQEQRRKQKHEKRTVGVITGPISERWNRLEKRQKLYIQIGAALLFIGVAVAIAVGITVAVNGSVYVGEDKSKQIPDPSEQ